MLPLPRPFVPLHVLGDRLLVGDRVIVDERVTRPFEEIREGAWCTDDGDVVPVAVRFDPDGRQDLDSLYASQLQDAIDARRWARTWLRGRGAPRVLARILADGTGRHPRGSTVGTVEEWVGDVRVIDLLAASRSAGGVLPTGVALAIARGFALPFAAYERLFEPLPDGIRRRLDDDGISSSMSVAKSSIWCEVSALFVDDFGRLRGLIDSYPAPSHHDPLDRLDVISAGEADLRFLSPETINGHGRTVYRSPMFSLGMLLFEMLASAHPFAAPRTSSNLEMLKAISTMPVPSLAAQRPDAPAPIVQLVARLTEREPDARFERWSHVLAAIDGAALRTEQAGPDEIAAVVRGLLPDVVAAADERREQLALLDPSHLTTTLSPLRGYALVDAHAAANPLAPVLPADIRERVIAPALPDDWDDVTPAESDAPFIGSDGRGMYVVDDGLRIDASPVTQSAWAGFCAHGGRAPPVAWAATNPADEQAEQPVTGISFDDAAAYAAFYGKDLPTDDEWQRAVDVLGVARLGIGAVWEWTSTRQLEGWVVRGGRFRGHAATPSDGQTASWRARPADDVGFRCVVRLSGARRP